MTREGRPNIRRQGKTILSATFAMNDQLTACPINIVKRQSCDFPDPQAKSRHKQKYCEIPPSLP
jgi:hypothetical protein